MTLIRPLTLCCLILSVPGALAGRLEIPLRVPFEPIREALVARLAASSATPNVIFRDGRAGQHHGAVRELHHGVFITALLAPSENAHSASVRGQASASAKVAPYCLFATTSEHEKIPAQAAIESTTPAK